jgi:hypothetical protein
MPPKKKPTGFKLSSFMTTAAVIGVLLTCYIAYRASISDRKLFSVGMLTMFAGLLFESFRVLENKRSIFEIFIFAYLFSLLAFIPGKREHNYSFESHIHGWPYAFLVIYALFFVVFNQERFTSKLNEGITMVLSLSLIYWAIDYGFTNYHNWFSISVMVIGALLCVFSIIHALTYIPLTRTVRLILSIWSSFILVAFAIDSMVRVFSNPEIEDSKYMSESVFIGLQYFLLGVAAIYIMRNFLLLISLLPSKNGNRKKDLREGKQEHMNRYSNKQANIFNSILCLLIVGTIYWLNHKYEVLPRHTAIWLVFFGGSIIWSFLDKRNRYY